MRLNKKLYQMTAGDKAIFERARRENNPNYITNYYLRGENTGTWWRPVDDSLIAELTMEESRVVARRWQNDYAVHCENWHKIGEPEFFFADGTPTHEPEYNQAREQLRRVYRVIMDGGQPIFYYPHGLQLIDWQLQSFRAIQAIKAIIGGFGSSKTWSEIIGDLVHAVTLPGYRGFVLAPYSIQVMEVYQQALTIFEGTLFERFVLGVRERPAKIILGNDLVGKNSIEFHPILDDPKKILNLSGDDAMIDQAEQLPDIDGVIRATGSRLRGMYRGRPRRGQIALVANSDDNPQLWDLYDEKDTDPRYVWAHNPATFDNPYLTIDDLFRLERQVGQSPTSQRVHLLGERPMGSGEHFPLSSVEKCRGQWLDDMMEKALRDETPGWERREAQRCGVIYWQRPPEEGHIYLQVADPGWGNPPMRNAAAIMVWDISDFPRTPASLSAFSWVFGNGSPNPWIAQYMTFAETYHTIGKNGFDSTGLQSGYERTPELSRLFPTPVNLGGAHKYIYLTLTKKIMADGLFQVPNIIHLFSQLSKYRLPDEKLRQDLVMTLLITSALLEPLFYTRHKSAPGDVIKQTRESMTDRYWRPDGDRYVDEVSIREER